jgi:hypothetical protein
MRNEMNQMNPTAVITHSLSRAIDTIKELYDVREVMGMKRRIIGKDGRLFLIIFAAVQVYGLEFDDMIVIPGANKNPEYDMIYSAVKARIRNQ